jgi:hypothetical protein
MGIAIDLRATPNASVDAGSFERLKASVEALDMAVNAVLIVAATSDWRIPPLEESGSIPLILIENQLPELTGFTGWSGIIRSRDILRDTVSAICRKEARQVRPSEVIMIVNMTDSVFAELRRLVEAFADSVIRNAL